MLDDVEDDLVGMIFFVSCLFFCLVVLVLVVIAVNTHNAHGGIFLPPDAYF